MSLKSRDDAILLENLTYEELAVIAKQIELVILPVGSTEQHGPHLPLNVDAFITYEVAKAVSAKTKVPVAPLVSYGPSMTHKKFPGTISLRPETLMSVIIDICDSLISSGFRKILILNGHVPNEWVLKSAMDILRAKHEHARIKVMNYFSCSEEIYKEMTKDGGDHANFFETSLMLYLNPQLVKVSKIVDEPARPLPFDIRYDQRSKSGVWGKPSLATINDGKRIFDMIVSAICKWVDWALREET